MVVSSCASDTGEPTMEYVPPPDGPPAASSEFLAFVDGREYAAWTCELAPHPAREPSPHGMNRICQNSIATAARDGSGPWPVGAASVKEQYDGGGNVFAFEISLKERSGSGPEAWRFWRGQGTRVTNDAVGASFCSNCHEGADRDFVFTVVR